MLFVGIDLGATNTAVAIVDSQGTIIRRVSTPTPLDLAARETVQSMAEQTLRLLADEGLCPEDITALG
ncbi:MAG: hypothetical protein LBP91_01995, partial [Coriobacteriales bacterium]|nr:hypothetical protein [Coriobacteriales bacterium]